jgi:cell surface protein SprA
VEGGTSNDFGDNLMAIVRLGNDFQGNFYEMKIPLTKTNWGDSLPSHIWPDSNNLDFDLQELPKLKTRRDNNGVLPSQYYSETLSNGRVFGIIGNPNLGIKGMLLAANKRMNRTVPNLV